MRPAFVFAVLMGSFPNPSRAEDPVPTPEAIRSAIVRAIPPILKSIEEYPESRDCFSCHHQALPALALSLARSRGFAVEEASLRALAEHTLADLENGLDEYKKGQGQPGGTTRAGYALFTLETLGQPRSEVTEAVAGYLLDADKDRDHWRTRSNRPPSESSEFTVTYLAARGLRAFGAEARKQAVDGRSDSARRWLETARVRETEDRVFRLLASRALGSAAGPVRAFSDDLLMTQNPDGGWSQLDGKPSDAYATGSVLVALHQAGGLAPDDPSYRRGLGYLVRTQRDDGTWLVVSRSKPFQPYFESGFPHGKDQFISIAASSWASAALILATPRPEAGR